MAVTLTYGALNLTASPYMLELGGDWGAPQNAYETLALLLQDGEVELSDRASNRTLTFNIVVEGASLAALATAEADLVEETEKPLNTITIDPGDSGPVTVHETFRGQVTLVRDDDWEQSRMRRYTVTVKASPFPRSNAEVTATALGASGTTTTLVDACSATTNWTGNTTTYSPPSSFSSAPSVVSGAVGVTTAAWAGAVLVALTRTASITTSSTKYLQVDWRGIGTLRAYGDGVELTKLSEGQSPTAGTTRTVFYVAAASIAVLRLDNLSDVAALPGVGSLARSFYVDNINRTDTKPAYGTNRQLSRTIAVSGSQRSPGSIAIEHASSALGDVLAYFWPDDSSGYTPPLRQYRVSGGTVTADAAQVSGSTEPLNGAAATFDIPITRLPTGSYLLMVRMTPGASGTLTWTAQTRINSTAVGPALTGTYPFIGPSGYSIAPVARLQLPTLSVPLTSPGFCRITLATSAASTFDEAWLFNTTIGQLVQVACGTASPASGGAANRVFLEPATTALPFPTVRIGFAADRSDSFFPPTLPAWQFPQFYPPLVNVFTVTTNALDASVTLRAYPRWHTHAAS